MAKIAIILANLGSPNKPTVSAVSRYLGQFLSDERVIDVPRYKWNLILRLIRFTRSKPVSHTYQSVWTNEGSPIIVITKQQADKLAQLLAKTYPQHEFEVRIGMSYGWPDLTRVTKEVFTGIYDQHNSYAYEYVDGEVRSAQPFSLQTSQRRIANEPPAQNFSLQSRQSLANSLNRSQTFEPVNSASVDLAGRPDFVILLPMYPQFSSTTVLPVIDAFNRGYMHKNDRFVPPFSIVHDYAYQPSYITALANSVIEQVEYEQRQAGLTPESPEWKASPKEYFRDSHKLFISYHGIPSRYISEHNDPYPLHCEDTTNLLVERLGLEPHQYMHTYQSVFGKEPWIDPKTDHSLVEHAKAFPGEAGAMVMCPCFAADCIETLEENGIVNRELFHQAGGKTFSLINCLNDRDDHIYMMQQILDRHIALAYGHHHEPTSSHY